MTQTIKKIFLIFVLALAMPVGVAFGDCVSDTMNALRNGDLTNSPEFRAFEKSITDSENKKYNAFANKIPGYMNGLMDLKENGNIVATIQVVCTGTQKYSECEYTCIDGDCDENPKQTFIARQSGAHVGKQLTGYIYREYSTEYCSNLAQYRGRQSAAPTDDDTSIATANTQYHTISGTVTDAATGNGLAGITVTANKVPVTTNANGKYAISVPTSVLTMSVSDPNKHYNDTKVTIKSDTQTKNITMDGKVCTLSIANAQYATYRDNKCTVTLCKSGYEPNADKTKCQELKTTSVRTITGVITDENTGNPLPGITVYTATGRNALTNTDVKTDTNGMYKITNVPDTVKTIYFVDPNKRYMDKDINIASDATVVNYKLAGMPCNIANASSAAYRDNKCTVINCSGNYKPSKTNDSCTPDDDNDDKYDPLDNYNDTKKPDTSSHRGRMSTSSDDSKAQTYTIKLHIFDSNAPDFSLSDVTITAGDKTVVSDSNGVATLTFNTNYNLPQLYSSHPNYTSAYVPSYETYSGYFNTQNMLDMPMNGKQCTPDDATGVLRAQYERNECKVLKCTDGTKPVNNKCNVAESKQLDAPQPSSSEPVPARSTTTTARASAQSTATPPATVATTRTINGGVIDDITGNGLTGITVTVSSTGKTTKTDTNGGYTIEAPNTSIVLIFENNKYNRKTLSVPANSTKSAVIAMQGKKCTAENASTARYCNNTTNECCAIACKNKRDYKIENYQCIENSPQNNANPTATKPQSDKTKHEKTVAQPRTITGTVKDKLSGNNLSGIRVKDTASGKSATTDKNGKFSISGVANTGPVNLVIESSHYTGGVSVSTTNDAGIISATGNDCTKSIAHATNAYYQDNKCTLQECADGYDPKNNKCEKKTEEKNTTARSVATQTEPKTKTATQPQAKSDTHNISGTVIDKRSRNPLSGVNVCVNSNCVNTADDGTFTLSDVTKNTARLTFTVNNYKSDYKTVYGFQDKIGNFALEGIECEIDNGTGYYQDNACKLNKCNKGYTQDGNTCVEKTTNTNSKKESDKKPILGDKVVTTSQNNQITETKTRTITGTVTENGQDGTGEGTINNATISVKEHPNITTKTNFGGKFTLKNVPLENVTLNIEHKNYKRTEFQVNTETNYAEITMAGVSCTDSKRKITTGFYTQNYGCCATQCADGYAVTKLCDCFIQDDSPEGRKQLRKSEKEQRQQARQEKRNERKNSKNNSESDKENIIPGTTEELMEGTENNQTTGENESITICELLDKEQCDKQMPKCIWMGTLCRTIGTQKSCSDYSKRADCKKDDNCKWDKNTCIPATDAEVETKCNKLKDKNECDANTACSWDGKRCTKKKAEKQDKEAPTENDNNAPSAKSGSNTTDKSEQTTTNNNQQQPVATRPRYTAEDVERLEKDLKEKKETEQSLENRTLAATSMAATGAGMMATMTAAAEKQADEDAERDMRAYLATFTCDYGGGKTYRGGETGIELPGANNLIGLYTEYAKLSADLAERKSALGLRPGIESAVVIDKATTNMYGGATTSGARPSGAYASIARAILDPESEDAKQWAAQRAATDTKLKAGIAASVAGVATGVIGNIAINAIKKREVPTQALKKLEADINALPPATGECPAGSTGTAPYCTCIGNYQYSSKSNECIPCPGNKIINSDGECICPDKTLWFNDKQSCEKYYFKAEPKCDTEQDANLYIKDQSTGECGCLNNFDEVKDKSGNVISCSCDSTLLPIIRKEIQKGKCVQVSENIITKEIEKKVPVVQTVEVPVATTVEVPVVQHTTTEITDTQYKANLEADGMFELGKATLVPASKEKLSQLITDLSIYAECNLTITGGADPYGYTPAKNLELSKNRAESVKVYLETHMSSTKLTITAEGEGQYNCNCSNSNIQWQQNGKVIIPNDKIKNPDYAQCHNKQKNYAPNRFAPCRRIVITGTCAKNEQNTTTIQSNN